MINLLKEVLKHEVYPAMGCTEPVSVAFAAASASKLLEGDISSIKIITDQGTYKNGLAVSIPNTDGKAGNLLASALGAVSRRPELGAELFGTLSKAELERALELLQSGKVSIEIDPSRRGIYISAEVRADGEKALCVLINSHKAIALLTYNDKVLMENEACSDVCKSSMPYKALLKDAAIKDLFREVEDIDEEDLAYIKKGVEMNLSASKAGMTIRKVGYYINDLIDKKYVKQDILSTVKVKTASATDARMAGVSVPVMSSGESGNQGVVAILVPWIVGSALGITERTILKSIALSHLINSYIKVFTGELAPICGCAVAAGVGASVAIVYQLNGPDEKKTALAVNNIISDIGGMLCDGAKSGCALKVASSADSAVRAAFMANNGAGITGCEGFIGDTAEDTIKNMARISRNGMDKVDRIILDIMSEKLAKDIKIN